MIIAVRHGSTISKNNKERLDGWTDVRLDDKGIKDSKRAANYLWGMKFDIHSFYTSNLIRARETASELSDVIKKDLFSSDCLKDWNTGCFTGRTVRLTKPTIDNSIDTPNYILPEGESFCRFYQRVTGLKPLIEGSQNYLVVTHPLVITLLNSLCTDNGKTPNDVVFKQGCPVEPGGILYIDNKWKSEVIFLPALNKEKRKDYVSNFLAGRVSSR